MGTLSEKILGSDNAKDVYEDYFLLYNEGKNVIEISNYILNKYFKSSIDIVEKSEYLGAFCKAKWETKSLELEILNQLKELVMSPKLYELLSDYGASDKFIKARKKELNNFIKKISIEKPKAKSRKKPPVELTTQFENGNLFTFKYKSGEYGGIAIIKDELYTTKGSFLFALTTIRQSKKPTISDFLNSTFDRCEWYEKIAGIDSYNICYLTKKERIPYFEGLESFFTFIGTIKPFENGYHSSSGIDLSETNTFEQVLSLCMEYAHSDERKKSYLEIYKKELKPDTIKLKEFHSITKKD